MFPGSTLHRLHAHTWALPPWWVALLQEHEEWHGEGHGYWKLLGGYRSEDSGRGEGE